MRFNRKKHQLLKRLAEKYSRLKEEKDSVPGIEAGIPYSEIRSLLKITEHQRKLLLAEMRKAEEVVEFKKDDWYGCYINPSNGLESLSNKKYQVRNRKIIKDGLIDFVQIAVPVLSLLITILVIVRDDSKRNSEIEAIEEKIEKLQNRINDLESTEVKD